MDLDPIVLLAYVSVAINVITMIAACAAYGMFHVRKRRRRREPQALHTPSGRPGTAVFLRPVPLSWPSAAAELPAPDTASLSTAPAVMAVPATQAAQAAQALQVTHPARPTTDTTPAYAAA